MTEAVSRLPFTAEARVRSRVSPCGICDEQLCTGIGFSPRSSVLLSISFHCASLRTCITWRMNNRPISDRSSETISLQQEQTQVFVLLSLLMTHLYSYTVLYRPNMVLYSGNLECCLPSMERRCKCWSIKLNGDKSNSILSFSCRLELLDARLRLRGERPFRKGYVVFYL
jgi:hypothetical protein